MLTKFGNTEIDTTKIVAIQWRYGRKQDIPLKDTIVVRKGKKFLSGAYVYLEGGTTIDFNKDEAEKLRAIK